MEVDPSLCRKVKALETVKEKNFLFLHRLYIFFFCVKKKMEEDTTHNQKRRDGLDGMGAKLLVRGSHHLPQFCSLISPSHFRLLHHNSNVLKSGKKRDLYVCIEMRFSLFLGRRNIVILEKKTFGEIIICIAFQRERKRRSFSVVGYVRSQASQVF